MIELVEFDLVAKDPTFAPTFAPIWVVVRHGATVLGEVRMRPLDAHTARRLPFELRARFEPVLQQHRDVAAAVGATREPVPSITVVMRTRGNAADLDACLEHLDLSHTAPIEVVVIDASSTDHTVVESSRHRRVAHRVVEVDGAIAAARNEASRIARGDVVAFVDDDRSLDRYAIGALARAFSHPGVDVVAGLQLPSELETYSQVYWARRGPRVPDRFTPRTVGRAQLASPASLQRYATASVAYRRDALLRIGGFATDARPPSALAMAMSTLRRSVEAGHVVLYQPSVVVRYRPPVTRSELLARVEEEARLARWYAEASRELTSGRRSTMATGAVTFARALRRHELLDAQVALAEQRGARHARNEIEAAHRESANPGAIPSNAVPSAQAVGG